MGRIDHTYLAAKGTVVALEAHWSLLVGLTVAAVLAYAVASARARSRSGNEVRRH
ncbi:MAG TPA: hypothetical protein VGN80_10590 [Devosiaceae bacterium]|jgi:hypothetical protein|nr:hypothetical protein [Devosiaceae bacterium]